MATSPVNIVAHTLLPNLVRLKGATAFTQAVERKDQAFFEQTWKSAYLDHTPKFFHAIRENTDGTVQFRIGVIDLPPPNEMGDAYMAAAVVKKNDSTFGRFFLLEKDWVMKTKQDKTTITEREGAGASGRRAVHFDGPNITGNWDADAKAFVDAFMEILVPTKVARK